jgi:hypothetical protein
MYFPKIAGQVLAVWEIEQSSEIWIGILWTFCHPRKLIRGKSHPRHPIIQGCPPCSSFIFSVCFSSVDSKPKVIWTTSRLWQGRLTLHRIEGFKISLKNLKIKKIHTKFRINNCSWQVERPGKASPHSYTADTKFVVSPFTSMKQASPVCC